MAQGWECVAVEFGGTRPEAREYKTCVPWVAFVFPESETNEKLPYQYGCGCARCGRCECCGCCGDAVGGAGMMGCGCCGGARFQTIEFEKKRRAEADGPAVGVRRGGI